MSLICEDCGHKYEFHEAEQHEATMTRLVIGCPECSSPITYQRVEA